MRKLVFFAIAGGIGFIVDVLVLYLALEFTSLGEFLARPFAIASAMACTWVINRTYTFEASGRSLASEGTRYGSVGLTSAFLNYIIYSVLLLTIPAFSPFMALTFASALATAFSFFGYSRFVFGKS